MESGGLVERWRQAHANLEHRGLDGYCGELRGGAGVDALPPLVHFEGRF
jgi:hypothetical protein